METPGALVETRIPGVIVPSVIVPVCAVKGVSATLCASETPCVSGVVASVSECVLPSTPCVNGAPRVNGTACAPETARVCEPPRVSETPRVSAPVGVSSMACGSEARCVSERPSVRKTACVRSLCVREMSVGMREHAAASPGVSVSVMEWSLGVVTRGSVGVERRRRLRQL